jgi:hypothetical protein
VSKPTRLRLSRAKGFDLQTLSLATNGLPAIVVARPTKWGNPFVVGQDGTRRDVTTLFSLLISGRICLTCKTGSAEQLERRTYIVRNLDALRDKNLACWCPLDAWDPMGPKCHADVLLDIANRDRAAA